MKLDDRLDDTEIEFVKIYQTFGKNGVKNKYEIKLKAYKHPVILTSVEALMNVNKFCNAVTAVRNKLFEFPDINPHFKKLKHIEAIYSILDMAEKIDNNE